MADRPLSRGQVRSFESDLSLTGVLLRLTSSTPSHSDRL